MKIFNTLFGFAKNNAVKIAFLILVVSLSTLSYGKAFDFYFWRDDAKVVWMQRFTPALINNLDSLGVARGRIGAVVFDYLSFNFLGYSYQTHQFFGYILRLLLLPLIFLVTRQLFPSKRRVAYLAVLLSAPFIGGLEAFSWVRGIGMMMLFALTSFYFYLKSYNSNKIRWVFPSILFLFAAISMDMWRAMGLAFVILLWEILGLFAKSDLKRTKKYVRISILVTSVFLVFRFMLASSDSASGAVVGSANSYLTMALEGKTWQTFFTSIGNVARSPILYIREEGGITDSGITSLIIGISILVFGALVSLNFLFKRDKRLIPFIVLVFWTFVFYGPNWLYAQKLETASTHRYIAFSSLVFPILWAYIAGKIMNKQFRYLFLSIYISAALFQSLAVNQQDYSIRGASFSLPLWNRLVSDTPIGETNQMLSVTGNNRVVGYVFAWSDVFPFAYLKNIASPSQLPVYVDEKMAAGIICKTNTRVSDPTTLGFKELTSGFSLEKTYAWEIKDEDNVTETTDDFRKRVGVLADCIKSKQSIQIDGVKVVSASLIPLKQNKKSFSLQIEFDRQPTKNYFLEVVSPKGESFIASFDNHEVVASGLYRNALIPERFVNKDSVFQIGSCGAFGCRVVRQFKIDLNLNTDNL